MTWWLLRVLALIVVLLAGWATLGTADTGTGKVTRHEAKVRTFKALLRITEQPPDVADATHATITVAGCKRHEAGWLCHGSLHPVAFSGIGGATCPVIVTVYPHSTRVHQSQCTEF